MTVLLKWAVGIVLVLALILLAWIAWEIDWTDKGGRE